MTKPQTRRRSGEFTLLMSLDKDPLECIGSKVTACYIDGKIVMGRIVAQTIKKNEEGGYWELTLRVSQ